MNIASPLLLDIALIDWITLTSYEKEFLTYWSGRFRERGKKIKEHKILQYYGESYELDGGTGFIGAAMQNGRENYMLRLSGYAAEDNKNPAIIHKRAGIAKCTRIDLQVTTEVTNKWSQWDLLVRLKARGKMTGWIESKDGGGRFETVYLGSRTSERFTRIYIKSNSPRLLRVETEYKRNRADAVLRGMAGDKQASEYMTYEVQNTIGDKGISAIFEPLLAGVNGFSPRLVPNTSLEKQEAWLLGQVLPAFTRHINDHNASGKVLLAFSSVIRDLIDD